MALPTLEGVKSPPEYFNFATDVVDKWAEKNPSALAMQWINDQSSEPLNLTYGYFSLQSRNAARLLVDLGAKPGDRLMIILNRVPAWWEIATAVLRAGLVLCPCTTLATPKDIEYRLKTSGASFFVGNEQTLGSLARVRSSCPSVRVVLQADGKPLPGVTQYRTAVQQMVSMPFPGPMTKADDPALIYFTSGTTGLPKMVLHTQVSYPRAHLLTGIHWLGLCPGKLYWTLAEQGWAKAAWSWFATWNTGATLFIQDNDKPFSPTSILDVLHRYPITTLCAPPTAYRQMVTVQIQAYFASNPPKALEISVGAGEPLNPAVIQAWHSMSGMEIRDGYGQTETILIAGNCTGVEIRQGSMGKGVPGVPIHVIDGSGRVAEKGQEGDIAVLTVDENGKRTPFVCQGYISRDGEITRKSRLRIDNNGSVNGEWHLTGDRACEDRDGYLWFVGRDDDVISSSGYRIGPFEVESTLKLHPSVVESAVVGVKDKDRGEIVKAFVVLDPSFRDKDPTALQKELQDHCKREAAPYKYPRSIVFVSPDWLPKTTSGKIRRAEIRRWAREGACKSHI